MKGMLPALFDEAFPKMDGKNQCAMFSFYADLGLQVVIAAQYLIAKHTSFRRLYFGG
jgi:hypothetical protein